MLETITPAVYHCTAGVLEELDRVQERFLKAAGLTQEEVLLKHNLVSLQTRRDVVMLGIVHRTVLKKGAPQFQQWFRPETRPQHPYRTRLQSGLHTKQIYDYSDAPQTEVLRRLCLGLVQVYNKLPQKAVDSTSVKALQAWLQTEAKKAAETGKEGWNNLWNRRQKN